MKYLLNPLHIKHIVAVFICVLAAHTLYRSSVRAQIFEKVRESHILKRATVSISKNKVVAMDPLVPRIGEKSVVQSKKKKKKKEPVVVVAPTILPIGTLNHHLCSFRKLQLSGDFKQGKLELDKIKAISFENKPPSSEMLTMLSKNLKELIKFGTFKGEIINCEKK